MVVLYEFDIGFDLFGEFFFVEVFVEEFVCVVEYFWFDDFDFG